MMRIASRHLWAAAGLALLFTVLLVPLPAFGTRLAGELENFGHAPLFMAVTWGGVRWLRERRDARSDTARFVLAGLVAAFLAALTELVQPLTGRDGSLHDFYTDMLGSAAALLALAACGAPARGPGRVLLGAGALLACTIAAWPLLLAISAYQHRSSLAPRLADPDTERGRYFLQRQGVHLETHPGGGWLVVSQQTRWPGLTIDEVVPDWRGYRALVVDAGNPGGQPLNLLIRIDDSGPGKRYIDHFNASTFIAPGTRVQWRLPLAALQHRSAGRPLDLAGMRRVILFQDTTHALPAVSYVLYDLRLER